MASSSSAAGDQEASPLLQDCLQLLRADRDDQKLAGLLLASRLSSPSSTTASSIFFAVGPRFLRRLLLTGAGKIDGGGAKGGSENKDAYLRLALTVLAALARASQQVAADSEVVAMVPLIAEIASTPHEQQIVDECYEISTSAAAASEDGSLRILEPGAANNLFVNISSLPNASRSLELANQLMQSLVHKITSHKISLVNFQGVALMVTVLARMFAQLHNALKFDALHMLFALLSSKDPQLDDALKAMPSQVWSAHIRVGIIAVLQNRLASSEKRKALCLAECMMSILGENWLLEECNLAEVQEFMPAGKFALFVLECGRIEIALLLDELARAKYEPSKNSSSSEEVVGGKLQYLAISFQLIERIMNLISSEAAQHIHESTITKALIGLNETKNAVLDYLLDAKDHGQRKGDDLLAAVRFVGSFLAEAPNACKEMTMDLLDYMLSIEGFDESRPFYSVCFMLPFLSQITADDDGCRTMVSSGAYLIIVDSLAKMLEDHMRTLESGSILLACATIFNCLLRRKAELTSINSKFVHLLQVLALSTGSLVDSSTIVSAASICSMLLDLTTERHLLNSGDFDLRSLEGLSQLIIRGLNQNVSVDDVEILHRRAAIISGYEHWGERYPHIRNQIQESLGNGVA